jgi:1-acyl-sn-glycerol-3-phosphate acyltransferase
MSYCLISSITIASRALRLAWHLLHGLCMVMGFFRFLKHEDRDEITRQWSLKCLQILQVHMRINGDRPPHHATGIVFVSNHISWIDVLALNAIRPMCFVAKTEVRGWPIIGRLACRVGTVFFSRRPQDLLRVNRLMLAALMRGRCVALFPEGTTSAGKTVLRFHSGLFESAVEGQTLIWPVALRYYCADGSLAQHAAFVGDQSLIGSILQVLTQPAIHLDIRFLSTLVSSQYDRYELARRARTAILSTFHAQPRGPMADAPESSPSIDWSDEPSAAS